jgi:integrase
MCRFVILEKTLESDLGFALLELRRLDPVLFFPSHCLSQANLRRAMLRVLNAAKLPLHFTPHCSRHTCAFILLSEGVSPAYVQEQLGHATIELTVSTYGRWLKNRAPSALDRMDFSALAQSGSSGYIGNETGPCSDGARSVSSST